MRHGVRAIFTMALAAMLISAVPMLEVAKAQTSQQELMKSCNAQATGQKLTGDARKSFMSKCLSGKPTSTLTPQQQKMQTCNTQATAQKLSGDARKKFMSTCLKG
jgi:psiF repeat